MGTEEVRDCYGRFYANVSGQESPFVFRRGEGVFVENPEGETFIDFTSGYSVHNLGYGTSLMRRLMASECEVLEETGSAGLDINAFPHAPGAVLARCLAESTAIPSAKVFFCNSGTEAVEAALKLHRKKHRPLTVTCGDAFHGRTLGALTLTDGKEVYHEDFPKIPDVLRVPFPVGKDSFAAMRRVLMPRGKSYFRQMGRVVIELVQGEAGMRPADREAIFWLRKFTQEHGILLIIDEVQTGFGRTGTMFAYEQYGIIPDAICIAKGAGLGFSFGALIFRGDLDWKKAGQHSNTMGGNIPSAIAALECLRMFSETHPEQNAAARGGELSAWLGTLHDSFPRIARDVHGMGLMWGIDFCSSDIRDTVIREAYERRLLVIGARDHTIRVTPSLVIESSELCKGLHRLWSVCDEVQTSLKK